MWTVTRLASLSPRPGMERLLPSRSATVPPMSERISKAALLSGKGVPLRRRHHAGRDRRLGRRRPGRAAAC